jgi:6-phosphogluconolactonase/glucosamine-6-phosphate isomerase/deaminase
MIFIRISNPQAGSDYVADALTRQLKAGKKVLWLVPGGSGMDISVGAIRQLPTDLLPGLSISLTDERYGPVGHPDSNWRQLAEKGFDVKGVTLYPVLNGDDLKTTAQNYAKLLDRLVEQADYSLALAGMGADGHILGIKPGSPAVSSDNEVVGYRAKDYQRLSVTLPLLKKLDEVIIYAVGEDKHRQFGRLSDDIPYSEQPAQMLKALKKVIILNDSKGEIL